MQRRTFIKGLGAAVALAPGVSFHAARAAGARNDADPRLTTIDPTWVVTAEEAHGWHMAKDSMGGPTLAGSPSWRNFLELTEDQLVKRGVVDVFRNAWTYRRWFTSEWPDDSNWTLHVDGRKVPVASYGANSGITSDEGVTAELVVYEADMPPERLRGKIVIFQTPQARQVIAGGNAADGGIVRTSDYEYLSSPETFPDPDVPRTAGGRISPFGQIGVAEFVRIAEQSGAAGALFVIGLSYDALSGVYNFPVPGLYDVPALMLDRDAGARVIAAARARSRATLRMLAETEQAETYQLFGYLPGRHFGTPDDEQIMLVTHTDGPSISQDNGALGILGIVHYFAHLARADRPRTLVIFLDCRHFMPGAERAFGAEDYADSHPEIHRPVVTAMGIEHLGQYEYVETDDEPYHQTDVPELSSLWVTNNDRLVELAIKAIKDNGYRRVQVQCPGRPGVHGELQGPWYGLGRIAGRLGVPGASTMGTMSAYWSTKARIDAFNAPHFVEQVSTMTQICGELMTADLMQIGTAEGDS